jgi:4-amino-4-deoxy-L-arabinose transferase-like glycosyltransferase
LFGMTRKPPQWIVLSLILLVAAALRLTGLAWDDYNHYHPDERYIRWVAVSLSWPQDWSTAFHPRQSTLNPFYWPPDGATPGLTLAQDEPRRFAYGHAPLYLGVAATWLAARLGPHLRPYFPADWTFTRDILNGANWIPYRHGTAVGRALTALFDVGTVGLLFLLGRSLFTPTVGLLSAALLAVTVIHIQSAHFFIVDPYLTFFTLLALYLLVRRPLSLPHLLLAGVAVGLAVGAKFAAVLLLIPLLVAALRPPTNDEGQTTNFGRLSFVVRPLAALAAAVLIFALTNPFALLDHTCRTQTPAVQIGGWNAPRYPLHSCYLDNVLAQSEMARGRSDLAFTRQYEGTAAYLYPAEMQLRWGMGPLLGLLALVGLAGPGVFIWRGGRSKITQITQMGSNLSLSTKIYAIFAKFSWQWRSESWPHLLILLWLIPFLVSTGGFYVKFMRYLLPALPILILYGVALFWPGGTRRYTETNGEPSPISANLRVTAANLRVTAANLRASSVLLTLLFTSLYALSFVNIYRQPHPWTAASDWIYDNVPANALILGEQWDDLLPKTLNPNDPARRFTRYRRESLTWMSNVDSRDNPENLRKNLELLADADYLALASNRVYGVLPRQPERYPLGGQVHQMLFDDRLGYEVVYVGGVYPNLAGLHLKHDLFGWPGLTPPPAVSAYLDSLPGLTLGRVDESFIVYDQPLVIILANEGRLTAVEMAALFSGLLEADDP